MESGIKLRCCDYAHYYLGCRYRYTYKSDNEFVEDILDAILYNGMLMGDDKGPYKKEIKNDEFINSFEVDDFKNEENGEFQLFLRHSSDMTDLENNEYKELCRFLRDEKGRNLKLHHLPYAASAALDYLCRNGIDAFGLLEFGNAIDINRDASYLKGIIDRDVQFREGHKIPTRNNNNVIVPDYNKRYKIEKNNLNFKRKNNG